MKRRERYVGHRQNYRLIEVTIYDCLRKIKGENTATQWPHGGALPTHSDSRIFPVPRQPSASRHRAGGVGGTCTSACHVALNAVPCFGAFLVRGRENRRLVVSHARRTPDLRGRNSTSCAVDRVILQPRGCAFHHLLPLSTERVYQSRVLTNG